MIPILSHIEQHDGFRMWVTLNHTYGISLQVDPVDPELEDFDLFISRFRNWAQRLDPRIIVRLNLESKVSREINGPARKEAFRNLGFRMSHCTLSLEASSEFPILKFIKEKFLKTESNHHIKRLLASYEDLDSSGLKWRALSESEIENLFFRDAKSWVVCESFVSTGENYKAVIRLNKPSSDSIPRTLLDQIKLNLPLPFEVSVSFSRLSRAESQIYLKKKIEQSSSGSDHIEEIQTKANEEALEKTYLNGESLFATEFLVTLTRSCLKELKEDLKACQSHLSRFGDTSIETFGALPSICASLPGSQQHVSFLEVGSSLGYYLPVFESGSSTFSPDIRSSLFVHRLNESLGEISILSKEHLNSNGVIVGASGRGKSGLIGVLSESLLNDPDVSMIKVDVGGSHSKECRLLGGTEFILNLNLPSGINPFQAIQSNIPDNILRAILTNFICILVLEDNETTVPKKIKLEIDDLLKNYVSKNPKAPSISDFFISAKCFSRKSLLSRWAKGGMYENAFGEKLDLNSNCSRLRYYNFSEIFQASDPDFAQAGMAAVLAQFNLEMILHPEKRLVLICDETPFFIKKCFEFFKFSTANVRKFGAAILLVVQLSEHLIVNGDHGIIENSFHRFLMSQDGDKDEFKARFKLTDNQLHSLLSLSSIPGKHSEFLYQFGERAFRGRLRLTAEEYWRITTTQSEKQKIDSLMAAVPDLTLKEALKCLSLIG